MTLTFYSLQTLYIILNLCSVTAKVQGGQIGEVRNAASLKLLLYPHFCKFNFNISFFVILFVCDFVTGVLFISYAILYPFNFLRKFMNILALMLKC